MLPCLMIVALLAACANQPATPPPAHSADARQAVSVALQQIGVPYRFGGATPSGFDCSGLVYYAYAQAGKHMPRTTASLWREMQPVDRRDVQIGDILFFEIAGKMSHVGLYIGDGQFVHAPATGRTVSVESLHSDFYRQAWLRAGRPE